MIIENKERKVFKTKLKEILIHLYFLERNSIPFKDISDTEIANLEFREIYKILMGNVKIYVSEDCNGVTLNDFLNVFFNNFTLKTMKKFLEILAIKYENIGSPPPSFFSDEYLENLCINAYEIS